MRIPMSCMDCSWDEINAEEEADAAAIARGETPPQRPAGRPIKREDWYLADIEQDNAYVERCRNGHEMRMTLQSVRYELLFESGIVATLVGFHREAVSSIAAALERFYEFATEVFTLRAGIEPKMHEAAWRHVTKQSERQLGAFLLLYLVNFGTPFKTGKEIAAYEERFGFRNQVIHQGYFPTQKEVLNFARYVYELILGTRNALENLDADALQKVEFLHWRRGRDAIEAKAGGPWKTKDGRYRSVGGAVLPMMLNSVIKGAPEDFESRLAASAENLWLWGFPSRRIGATDMIK